MASSKKASRLRLASVLSFVLFVPPWLAAQKMPKVPPARDATLKIAPEVAAAHLIKKVAPVYPAFAKAAGVQGIVSVAVSIGPDGHVQSIGPDLTGWACLWQAAMAAAGQYVYRPFTKDGRPIGVETTENITFELPGRRRVFQPPPPPQPTIESFIRGPNNAFENATPVADGPPEIRRWLLSQMRKDSLYSLWAKRGAFKSMKYGLPAKMVEIPTSVPNFRTYLITDNVVSPGFGLGAVLCGKNCGIWLVEDDAGTVRDGLRTAGWWFYARRREGSFYPDIFIAFQTPYAVDVYGYVNAGGYWGLLYYGALHGGGQGRIHVLRSWHTPLQAARQTLEIPPIRQLSKLPSEVAAAHLIKKVAPAYPAFAKVAGIQGVVRVCVVIYPDGHIHSICGQGPPKGLASLQQAAMDAAGGYAYRPFMKDGHPIYVETTEDILFKLPGQHTVFHPPPPPKLTLGSLDDFGGATPVADGPPEIRKWLLSQMKKDSSYSLAAKQGAWKGLRYGLPARMVEIRSWAPPSRFYMIIDNVESPTTGYSLCGSGGCDIWLVEDHAGKVREIIASAGFGFYVWRRKGAAYPVIFTAFADSASETDVDGYVNVNGHWGRFYCGTIQHGIHVCR